MKSKTKQIKAGEVIITNKFKAGDIICSLNNWKANNPLFFKASNDDVKDYSGNENLYLKIDCALVAPELPGSVKILDTR